MSREREGEEPFPHDGTRLGRELQKLEEEVPAVKAARARLEETFSRLGGAREDRVMAENLQVESESESEPEESEEES